MENSKINSYENEECMICLEPLNNEIAEVSCSHLFHYQCIKNWMKTNKNILRACCVCENNTEIINIINFDFSTNQNNLNQNIYENNLNQNNSNQNNINIRENLEENNNSYFSCCNIL